MRQSDKRTPHIETNSNRYKVICYKEGAIASILSGLFLGGANLNTQKFTLALNLEAGDEWNVVTMEKDIRRIFLFFKRESYVVILERKAA
ncbi:MAG: hypothetical protein ACI9BD_000399 [Candidatus Marinamargulisbacteria bacterium]|jgi:hypothetical protein